VAADSFQARCDFIRRGVLHVPQADTLVFQDRRDTRVELLPDTGHCAISKLDSAVTLMIDWLNQTLEAAPVAQ
jgi:hypothetical protein